MMSKRRMGGESRRAINLGSHTQTQRTARHSNFLLMEKYNLLSRLPCPSQNA